MAKKVPITDTVIQILRDAHGPLTIDEVAARLEARLPPGSSKNYKSSVRNSVTNNPLGPIVRLPDGRIGLVAQLLRGASVRHILHDEDLLERDLPVGADLANLLDPSGLPTRGKALRLELQGGPQILARFEGGRIGAELDAGPAFWDWLEARGAAPADSLIITAVDPEERRYALRLEPSEERDDAAVAMRNAEVLAGAEAILRRGRGRVPLWQIVAELNASGLLHKPVPPAPFEELWTEGVWAPIQAEYGVDYPLAGGEGELFSTLGRLLAGADQGVFDVARLAESAPHEPVQVEIGPEDLPPGMALEEFKALFEGIYTPDGLRPIPADHPLAEPLIALASRHGLPSPIGGLYKASQLQALFGSDDDTLDWIDEGIALGMVEEDEAYDPLLDDDDLGDEPVSLPAAYARTGSERKPVPSVKGRKGPVKTYVLRLSIEHEKGFWRDIEIAEDQNFEDLHLAVQGALGWDDDHLYSFFKDRHLDPADEIGSPWSDTAVHTHELTLGDIGLRAKQKFYYLFDYGDEHLFTLQVLKINDAAPKGTYPKVVAERGRAPSQYLDEDTEGAEDE